MSKAIREFYDRCGWEHASDGEGYLDNRLFTDGRSCLAEYLRSAETRALAFLQEGGKLFLDAGCGALPRVEYGQGFERHVCVDFSMKGLLESRLKLGDRGLYVMADIGNLPFGDGVFDGGVCAHVIYHIPGEQRQREAFREMHRTLKSGKTALVHYANPHHRFLDPSYWAADPADNFLSLLRTVYRGTLGAVGLTRRRAEDVGCFVPIEGTQERFYMRSYSVGWVKRIFPRGDVRVHCLRYLSHQFTRRFVKDRSHLWPNLLRILSRLEGRAPSFLAGFGNYVLVIITKR